MLFSANLLSWLHWSITHFYRKIRISHSSLCRQRFLGNVLKSVLLIQSFYFQKVVCVFCAFNITGAIKSLVQISILLNKSKIVEIRTKFFISRAILKAQKRQTTFWKWQDKENFVIIISRNSLLKLDWQINAANYIKNQDDIQVVLYTVMFRGTPCI